MELLKVRVTTERIDMPTITSTTVHSIAAGAAGTKDHDAIALGSGLPEKTLSKMSFIP